MNMEPIFLTLVGLNVFQTIYWSYQTHKLINKVMSTDYFAYKKSDTVVATKESKAAPQAKMPEQVKVDFFPS